jgi:hypothetical protein
VYGLGPPCVQKTMTAPNSIASKKRGSSDHVINPYKKKLGVKSTLEQRALQLSIIAPSTVFYYFLRSTHDENGSIKTNNAFPNIHKQSPLGTICFQFNTYLSIAHGYATASCRTDGILNLQDAVRLSQEQLCSRFLDRSVGEEICRWSENGAFHYCMLGLEEIDSRKNKTYIPMSTAC